MAAATNRETLAKPRVDLERDCAEDLLRLLSDALQATVELNAAEAEHAYRMALLAGAASGRRLRGGSAIVACATALGVSRQSLRSYAVLAARWTPIELRRLFNLRNALGRRLSASHLLILARFPRVERDELLERACAEALDVHTLRAILSASR